MTGEPILWADAVIEQVTVNYEDIEVRIREETGRTRYLRGHGHVGIKLAGFWDEIIVEKASFQTAHPFLDECLAKATGVDASGSPERNRPTKIVAVITLLDGVELIIAAARFSSA